MTHFYESLFADDAARPIAAGCFVLTVALYFVSKRVYARFHQPWLTPLLTVPVVLVAIVLGARIPYPVYFADTRWLMWLLGPATVAFAVPIFEYRHLLKKHWLSLSVGVTVGVTVGVGVLVGVVTGVVVVPVGVVTVAVLPTVAVPVIVIVIVVVPVTIEIVVTAGATGVVLFSTVASEVPPVTAWVAAGVVSTGTVAGVIV